MKKIKLITVLLMIFSFFTVSLMSSVQETKQKAESVDGEYQNFHKEMVQLFRSKKLKEAVKQL